MQRAYIVIFAWILILVGILAGGCSLYFAGPMLFAIGTYGMSDLTVPLWLSGFVTAIVAFWLARKIFRYVNKSGH